MLIYSAHNWHCLWWIQQQQCTGRKGLWLIFASVFWLLVNQKVQKFLLHIEHKTTQRRNSFYYILEKFNVFYVKLSLYLNCLQHIKMSLSQKPRAVVNSTINPGFTRVFHLHRKRHGLKLSLDFSRRLRMRWMQQCLFGFIQRGVLIFILDWNHSVLSQTKSSPNPGCLLCQCPSKRPRKKQKDREKFTGASLMSSL